MLLALVVPFELKLKKPRRLASNTKSQSSKRALVPKYTSLNSNKFFSRNSIDFEAWSRQGQEPNKMFIVGLSLISRVKYFRGRACVRGLKCVSEITQKKHTLESAPKLINDYDSSN